MSRENPMWGAPRIHGELLKLGIDLGETSVSNGAALLMLSLARLHGVNPGFQSANLLTMHISLPRARYDGPKQRAFWEELVRRVEALPGVRGAVVAQTLPMTIRYATPISIAELPPVKIGERPLGQFVSVTHGYFRTLGIQLRRGREFSDKDAPGSVTPTAPALG
jgi:putative ABC transport system permease protein